MSAEEESEHPEQPESSQSRPQEARATLSHHSAGSPRFAYSSRFADAADPCSGPGPGAELGFFDSRAALDASTRNLPHWYQDNTACWATFRLADSLPQTLLKQWREEREVWYARHPQPRTEEQWRDYDERFSARLQGWLDAGMGSCVLGKPEIGRIVAEALEFFVGRRYHLGGWVVMPNHVHVIFQTIRPFTPGQILHSWKSYTANRINQIEGRVGRLWQEESYDHLIRSPAQLHHLVCYVRENPRKAGLSVLTLNPEDPIR